MNSRLLLSLVTCHLSLVTFTATAATYYTPQTTAGRYGTAVPASYQAQGYRPYGTQTAATTARTVAAPAQTSAAAAADSGFYLSGNLEHSFSSWRIEMKNIGSILRWDGIDWNIFNVDAGYNMGGTYGFSIMGGLQYGIQNGTGVMTDDDITNGGLLTDIYTSGGEQFGVYKTSLSTGDVSGGSILGFNAALGASNMFRVGNAKIVPSAGYRSLSYDLKTSNTYGMVMETAECISAGGETVCMPVITDDGSGATAGDDTYYFYQGGASHKYKATWAGPYIALDLTAPVNSGNRLGARIEFGLPSYESTGDQPYRTDWKHPAGVRDSAGIGDAFHVGAGADWSAALTDNVSLTFGVTYDYYSVSNATAKTYLDGDYYDPIYQDNIASCESDLAACSYVVGKNRVITGQDAYNALVADYNVLKNAKWVATDKNEIKSVFKNLGARVGFAAKF